MSEPQPILSFSVSFFITIVNFFVLFWIFKRFLWKPVRSTLEKRAAKVKSELSDAAFSKGRAEELKTQYEGLIAGAESEADRLLKEAAEQASTDARALVTEARGEAEAIRARAEESATRERAATLEKLTGEIARIATEAAARLAGRDAAAVDASAAEALVKELGAGRGR
jgi:F-type H+-transporting ATPase subunit b